MADATLTRGRLSGARGAARRGGRRRSVRDAENVAGWLFVAPALIKIGRAHV